MIREIVNVPFKNIDTIYHIADIHIRNVKRHKEYREVFERTYEEISKDVKNAIIVVVGDIVHAKLEMSPELVDLTFDFFERLSNILPTIVITGNHDANLNNTSRMDALYPILKRITNDNIFYLRETGIYDVADLQLAVMSVFQNVNEYPISSSLISSNKIAIYHGTIHSAKTDTGFVLYNKKMMKDTFKEYDIVLLGDIHKRQVISKYVKGKMPQSEYVGSLIQQNHGEALEHGILKWDVKNRKSIFLPIHNDYGYVTIHVENGQLPLINKLPQKARIRLMVKDTSIARTTEILSIIRQKYPGIQDIQDIKVHSLKNGDSIVNANKIDIGDVRDVNFQNELIKNYILRNYNVEDSIIQKIFEINIKLNSQVPNRFVARNTVWMPKKFEFSNMFSYGENNVINFGNLNGIVGLFAPNATGKSNLIDALSFTIFDKSPRAWKANNVMNNKKNTYTSKLTFDINGNEYTIKRNAKREDLTNDVTVKTDFSIKQNGKRQSLNGDRRSSTNNQIRNYLGEYYDFVLTALIPQSNNDQRNNNFIAMRQSDRKILLTRFLDLLIFQELHDLAYDEVKKVKIILNEFEKRDFSKELSSINIRLTVFEKEYKEFQKQKNSYDSLYKQLNLKIKKLTITLIKIDIITDIDKLNNDKKLCQERVNKLQFELNEMNIELVIKRKTNNELQLEFDNIDLNVEDKHKLVLEIQKHFNETKHNYEKYKIKVESRMKELGDFNKLIFNESCDSCISNKNYVKSKLENTQELDDNEIIMISQQDKMNSFQKMLDKSNGTEIQYNLYIKLKDQLVQINKEIGDAEYKILRDTIDLDDYNDNIKKLDNNIMLYHQNEDNIKKNIEIQEKINVWEDKLTIISNGINEVNDKLLNIHGDLEVNKQQKQKILEEIKYVKELEKENIAYKYYVEAIERDGVPFDLIMKTVPMIEDEVNNILSQIVDFRITLGVDQESKEISPKIIYDENNIWQIELISGMENFITSIALRVALLSVSSLPRPNFLLIDEGFGTLDQSNVNNLYHLFNYLREQFDFILIVSHLDTIKDMVDTYIEIERNGEFSKIVH